MPSNSTSDTYDKLTDVKDEFEQNWQRAEEEWGTLWTVMDRDLRAYAGNTWTQAEIHLLQQEKREAIELPLIRSRVNWFTGYQRDNIKSIRVEPVEGSDQQTADDIDDIQKQVWYRGAGQWNFNQAFEDACKTGISLFGMYLDLTNDVVGNIKFYRRGFNSFALDPDFEKPDLSDCSWAIMRDFVTRDQAKGLLPGVDPYVIDNVAPSQRDNKFTFLRPFTRNFNNKNVVTYDQYYRRVTESRRVLIDRDSGAIRDIDDLPSEALNRLKSGIETIKENGEANLAITTTDKAFIEYCVILSGDPVYTGRDALGLDNKYPFLPMLCFFEPSLDDMIYRFQGIPRQLYDANRINNKRHMKILDVMDKAIYGSTKYLLGAVDDPQNELLQSGTKRLIGIQPGFSIDDVQDTQANIQGIGEIIQYSQVVEGLFNDLAGINETLLGNDEGGNTQVSGRLAEIRTANGVRANRKIFDMLDYTQQLVGQMLIEAIQKNYPPQKIAKMLGREPTEQFYTQEFEQYDAVVKQGIESLTQKDQYYFELVNLKREGLVNVPETEILKALPLAGKSELIKAIEAQEEQSQQQQQQLAELEQLQKELINSQIEQSLALAQERRGRVIADIGLAKERASESEQNRAQASLDRAKAMVEISKLRQDQLIQLSNFIRQITYEENRENEQKEADITQESLAVIQNSEDDFKRRNPEQKIRALQDSATNQTQGTQNASF